MKEVTPQHLLLVSNAFLPSVGGVENSLRHLGLEAKALGWDVSIVVSDFGLPRDYANRWRDDFEGLQIYRYPQRHVAFLGPLNLFLSLLSSILILRALKKRHPHAHVVSRHHFSVLSLWLAGFRNIKFLVPGVVSFQALAGVTNPSPADRLRRWVNHQLESFAFVKAQNFVFSETMRKQVCSVSHQLDKPKLTLPGVSTERFFPASKSEVASLRQELNLPNDCRLLLFVGRFVPAKGLEVLVNALARLSENTHLVLVGEGAQLTDLQKQAKDRQLCHRVYFRERVTWVEKYYRVADVFMMTSNYEPLGQTILEALASGLPIVAFSKKAGVMTATQELGFDEVISYADDYTEESLAAATNVALEKDFDQRYAIAEKASKTFCWNKLLMDLSDAVS